MIQNDNVIRNDDVKHARMLNDQRPLTSAPREIRGIVTTPGR